MSVSARLPEDPALAPVRSAIRRLTIVRRQTWYLGMAARLTLSADPTIPTACTDGKRLRVNAAWFQALPLGIQESAIAHEIGHCVYLHFARRGSRDRRLYNVAGDYAINGILRQAGFALGADWLDDRRFDGMSTDAIYTVLRAEQADGKDPHDEHGCGGVEDYKPQGQPQKADEDKPKPAPKPPQEPQEEAEDEDESGGDGEDDDAGDEDEDNADGGDGEKDEDESDDDAPASAPSGSPVDSASSLASEWTMAAAQGVLLADKAGDGSGSMARAASSQGSTADPIAALERYLVAPADYSYARPNRRCVASGVYRPGPRADRLGCVDVHVDVSGSISPRLLDWAARTMAGIFLAHGAPQKLRVVYWDARVCHVDEEADPIDVAFACPTGGGGTAYSPVVAWVRESGETPDVVIVLTDLEIPDVTGCYGGKAMADPGWPTLWVTAYPVGPARVPGWGEHVVCPID